MITAVQLAMYEGQYALQFGRWGQLGQWSVGIKTVSSFALTYCLVCLCCYLKRFDSLKKGLTFLGTNTLDILMLHYGTGELICMAFGFWYPVYDIPRYPAESFAWWHFYLTAGLTAVLIGLYLAAKGRLKKMVQVPSFSQ